MSFATVGNDPYWRPGELEACSEFFGEESHKDPRVVIVRNNTEGITNHDAKIFLAKENALSNGKYVINSMNSFAHTACKISCFNQWSEASINHPKFVEFSTKEDLYNCDLTFPYLIRLNNLATGEGTYLVHSESDIEKYFPILMEKFNSVGGYKKKLFAIELIDTKREGCYISYRIAIAGDSVISAYARISEDWLAITSRFKTDYKSLFVQENKRIQRIVQENRDEICRSISCLGLNHQGLDLILDKHEKMYFIEVQPFYFCGNINRTQPPFWNPYKPKELVSWLVNEKNDLYKEIPEYYDNWLDKMNHFRLAYKSLKKSYNVWAESVT